MHATGTNPKVSTKHLRNYSTRRHECDRLHECSRTHECSMKNETSPSEEFVNDNNGKRLRKKSPQKGTYTVHTYSAAERTEPSKETFVKNDKISRDAGTRTKQKRSSGGQGRPHRGQHEMLYLEFQEASNEDQCFTRQTRTRNCRTCRERMLRGGVYDDIAPHAKTPSAQSGRVKQLRMLKF